MNISFEHSGAWLLLLIPLALGIAAWLYFYREQKEEWSKPLKWLLASLRFLLFFALGFLLLEPYLIQIISDEERPKLLVYRDVSASVDQEGKNSAIALLLQAKERLSDKYDVIDLSFASDVTGTAQDLPVDSLNTDLGEVIEHVNQGFYGENIGAVVLATDGIITRGRDPRYMGLNQGAPVYTVLLGDTSIRPDLELSQLVGNKLAFLGNKFELRARVSARKYAGQKVNVSITHGDELVKQEEIEITSNAFSKELKVLLEADQVGIQQYHVELDILENEANELNNSGDLFVEILDNRTRVTVLARSPHPDIAALKSAIEKSEQYEVDVQLLEQWDQNIASSDLFILHGLPSGPNDLNKVRPILQSEKQVFAVVTQKTSLIHFNALNLGLRIKAPKLKLDEAGGVVNESFNLFNLSENEDLRRYPPMLTPFGDYDLLTDHQTALYQRIGNIETDKPLLLFTESDGRKTGLLIGEGWWRWRLFESMLDEQNEWADRIIQKTVQYLAIKQKRKRLAVEAPQKILEGEEVRLNAEYYNQAFELANDQEVNLSITDSMGQTFDYLFKPTNNAYTIGVGTLPPGSYTWSADVTANGERFEEQGTFVVMKNRAEFIRLTADHSLLIDLASKKNGKAYYPAQQEALINELVNLETAATVIHSSKEWTSIIDWKAILFIVALIASIEWFVRKFTGYV